MNIIAILRGLVLNPILVAFARGSLEAFVMGVILIGSDATFLNGTLPEELKAYVPLIVLGLRQIEGIGDKIDPAKQRRRDALREEAPYADHPTSPLQPGDVVGP